MTNTPYLRSRPRPGLPDLPGSGYAKNGFDRRSFLGTLQHWGLRFDGQILADERDCEGIMQQVTAIRSAMQSFGRTFLQDYASACLLELDENPRGSLAETRTKREKIIQDMVAFIDKAP
jgi:DNA-binding FrmR family transcriptional regulator